ncbi:MAG: hypothetical protein IV088_01085 [Hydrogenophaga sp.]|uniref:hypothetical protein n=1 Tax=Hydrogenophaga sp. TaxID=1904254 RepID=UPI0025C371BE|nr:hypothetical protein [Hydrogenophaga sp.]MBT9549414.1 hypothetical protein [Hydrogenophaga sp.]
MNSVANERLPLSAEDFAALEAWPGARRHMGFSQTPDWAFCKGFTAALVAAAAPWRVLCKSRGRPGCLKAW